MSKSMTSVLNLMRNQIDVRRVGRELMTLLLESGIATLDDLLIAAELPPDTSPESLLVLVGKIRHIGVFETQFDGTLLRWRLLDRQAAEKWLASHPNFNELLTGEELMIASSHARSVATRHPLQTSSRRAQSPQRITIDQPRAAKIHGEGNE